MNDPTNRGNVDVTGKPKRPRGNPNFKKGKSNGYYSDKKQPAAETDHQMSNDTDEKTPPTAGENGFNTPPPSSDANDLPFDIFDDAQPSSEELPLEGEVEEQAYGNIADPSSGTPPPPSGGSGTPPPPSGGSGTPPPPSEGSGTPNPPPPSDQPAAPEVTPPPRTEEDIRNEASQMVKVMLRGYEKLHDLGRYFGKVNMEELSAEHDAGKINLERRLPFGKKSTTVAGFFNDYNTSIEDNIVVSDEFKKEVTPPLERIAIKRGWTMGDEMFVALIVGEDLATKAGMLWGLKNAANMILESCRAIESGKKKRPEIKETPTGQSEPQPDPQSQQEGTYAQFHDDMPPDGWPDDPSRPD